MTNEAINENSDVAMMSHKAINENSQSFSQFSKIDKHVLLFFDEIRLIPKLFYNIQTDEVDGYGMKANGR